MHPETLAAQAGRAIDDATGAIVPPIHLSTTYARDTDYKLIDDRDYARDKNPTHAHAEAVLAGLEGGAGALTYASGMTAATNAIRACVRPGDHVIAPRACYFAVRSWLARFGERWGVGVDFVDLSDAAAVRAAVKPGKTKLVWCETPANPTWEVADIALLAEIAHGAGARLAVDSTCATPVHTRPLALGADLVMHSATKYLAGHSDVLAGALVTRADDEVWAELKVMRREEGAVLGAMESWLLLRGMRTLYARVERQSASALWIADKLAALEGVTVRYPGLASHPQHAIAAKQMTRGFGGMLSIQVGREGAKGTARALDAIGRLKVWVKATSLGGVESLVEHRASVEGPNTPTPPDLLRLSVGLEHPEDLLADLVGALQ